MEQVLESVQRDILNARAQPHLVSLLELLIEQLAAAVAGPDENMPPGWRDGHMRGGLNAKLIDEIKH